MSTENPDFGLFKDFPEAVFVMEPTGTILDANKAFTSRFIGKTQEFRGLDIHELPTSVHQRPGLAANWRKQAGEVLGTGMPQDFDEDMCGSYWRNSVYPVRSEDGEISRLLFIIREMTGKNLEEFRIRKENTVFRELLDAIPGAVFILDEQGLLVGCNDFAFELFGDRNREILDNDLISLFHPDDRDRVTAGLLDALESGKAGAGEARMYIHGNREQVRWFVLQSGRAMISGQAYLVVAGIDIDERKAAKEHGLRYNRWLDTAMAASDSGVWDWNVKTGELLWSDQIWSLYGLGKAEQSPSFKLWAGSLHPDDRDMTITAVKSAARQQAALNIEHRVYHPDGSIHWIMASGKPIFDKQGEVIRYCGTSIDISEQKQIDTELQRSRAHLDFALEKGHIGWWEMNLEDDTVLRTMEHARIFGYDSLLAYWSFEQFVEHIVPEDRSRINSIILDSIENKRDYAFECRISTATGEVRWIWSSGTLRFDRHGTATHILGIVQDITERKQEEAEYEKLQELFLQSQKMELVGQLAGGIAHDFNNALTAILGNIELLFDKVDRSSPLAEHITDIEKSAERSANLTRQLLAFARKEAARPKVLRVNNEIEKLLPMLRGLIGNHIQVVWTPNANGHGIHIDPSQLDQIIVNLCINSRDAIGDRGVISIETGSEQVHPADCAMGHPCQIAGDYVKILVSDTGSGIGPKTLPHIFEPFFTTKEIGKGTGLGLSTVYGVLKQNHGFIDCLTEQGQGTTFIVYLPKHAATSGGNEAERHENHFSHTGGTILLVEDESSILTMLTGLLNESGFTTLAAQDAQTAVNMAEPYPENIDLLITDIVLPDMNGVWLSNRLQERRPGLKTLFMSGYAQELIVHYDKLAEGINFLQKPFSINAFMNMVSQMLQSDPDIEPRHCRARHA
ncbi:MAG: PAS domain-containing protein [Chlorobiaceae bacterium]|nr:PAS domain-containing protein [Chlorobiaceae bacterium]